VEERGLPLQWGNSHRLGHRDPVVSICIICSCSGEALSSGSWLPESWSRNTCVFRSKTVLDSNGTDYVNTTPRVSFTLPTNIESGHNAENGKHNFYILRSTDSSAILPRQIPATCFDSSSLLATSDVSFFLVVVDSSHIQLRPCSHSKPLGLSRPHRSSSSAVVLIPH
jgi:hypothetical protein